MSVGDASRRDHTRAATFHRFHQAFIARNERLVSELRDLVDGAASREALQPDYWESWGAAARGARIVLTRAQKVTLTLVLVMSPVFLALRPHDALLAWVVAVARHAIRLRHDGP